MDHPHLCGMQKGDVSSGDALGKDIAWSPISKLIGLRVENLLSFFWKVRVAQCLPSLILGSKGCVLLAASCSVLFLM